MFYEVLQEKQAALAQEVNKFNEKRGYSKRITPDDVYFDDSRAWSLYVAGAALGLDCNKFGAYRAYLGGGVRGSVQNNGRDQEKTTELGQKFEDALRAIEKAYNEEDCPDGCEAWEQASGVLL